MARKPKKAHNLQEDLAEGDVVLNVECMIAITSSYVYRLAKSLRTEKMAEKGNVEIVSSPVTTPKSPARRASLVRLNSGLEGSRMENFYAGAPGGGLRGHSPYSQLSVSSL